MGMRKWAHNTRVPGPPDLPKTPQGRVQQPHTSLGRSGEAKAALSQGKTLSCTPGADSGSAGRERDAGRATQSIFRGEGVEGGGGDKVGD